MAEPTRRRRELRMPTEVVSETPALRARTPVRDKLAPLEAPAVAGLLAREGRQAVIEAGRARRAGASVIRRAWRWITRPSVREMRCPRCGVPAGFPNHMAGCSNEGKEWWNKPWDESQEGQEASRPEDLPVPANADKRYEEMDGG